MIAPLAVLVAGCRDGERERSSTSSSTTGAYRAAPSYHSDALAGAATTGPDRLSPDTRTVVELARLGGFEGVLTSVAGVGDRAPFRVRTLASPSRLVVDVASG